MRVLVAITHPAHAHFFKNAIRELEARGHEVVVTSRVKDLTTALLDQLAIPHRPLSTAPRRKSAAGLAREMLVHCWRLARITRRFRPDVLTQIAGTFVAPVGFLLRRPAVVFYDTEHARTSNAIAYPLARAVLTPACYRGRAGPRQVRYPAYHELAYLHPDVFTPDPAVPTRYGFDPDTPLYVLRFVGWSALHDYQEAGLAAAVKTAVVDELAARGRVLITSESTLPPELERYRSPVAAADIHHVLARAAMLVGESATMASEAACLGVPGLFLSSTPRGYTSELEERWGLVHNFTPARAGDLLGLVRRLAARPPAQLRAEYADKRRQMLAERISTTPWMVDWLEEFVRAGGRIPGEAGR